jgi:GFO/IDH/MocA oxidoreductase family protein
MSFKLGLVGLCTSHPESWVPIIRKMTKTGTVDVEIVCAWDSAETRPKGFTAEFCEKFDIPTVIENLEDMVDMVDGVIVHTTNWDKHIEQARLFVEADKAVILDKPIVGNMSDAAIFLDWIKQGKRITGGSSLRFTSQTKDFLAKPEDERGKVHAAYACIGVDDYNYGIHGYAIISSLMGAGAQSIQYIGSSAQKHIKITWRNGNIALLTVGKSEWLPFNLTVVTSKNVEYIVAEGFYESFLEEVLPYFTGMTDTPPLNIDEILEPELMAMAAKMSWQNKGQEIFLSDIAADYEGYDGTQFALEYRRARLG